MTDKEIAYELQTTRLWASWAKWSGIPEHSASYARNSVHTIHHIINSIDWEG